MIGSPCSRSQTHLKGIFFDGSEQLDSMSKAKEGMASFAKVVPCVYPHSEEGG